MTSRDEQTGKRNLILRIDATLLGKISLRAWKNQRPVSQEIEDILAKFEASPAFDCDKECPYGRSRKREKGLVHKVLSPWSR